jgi:hypothetical protein
MMMILMRFVAVGVSAHGDALGTLAQPSVVACARRIYNSRLAL